MPPAAKRSGSAIQHAMIAATALEGAAEDVGRHFGQIAVRMATQPGPDCLISGGEPTVRLVDAAVRGKGGRNQQLALAALMQLGDWPRHRRSFSGGTDGEDGPTDAAGAMVTRRDRSSGQENYGSIRATTCDATMPTVLRGRGRTVQNRSDADQRLRSARRGDGFDRSLMHVRRLSPTTIGPGRAARDRSRCGPWRRRDRRHRADSSS